MTSNDTNSNYPCICTHPFSAHRQIENVFAGNNKLRTDTVVACYAKTPNGYGFYCNCNEYRPDNLKYLEAVALRNGY